MIPLCLQNEPFLLVRPGGPVEVRQRDPTPVQVVAALAVAIDLDVHHHGPGLLDPPDLPQLNMVAESRRKVIAEGIVAHISRRHAGHDEKDGRTGSENH